MVSYGAVIGWVQFFVREPRARTDLKKLCQTEIGGPLSRQVFHDLMSH